MKRSRPLKPHPLLSRFAPAPKPAAPAPAELYAQALALFGQGRRPAAGALVRERLLPLQADHPDGLTLLGVVAYLDHDLAASERHLQARVAAGAGAHAATNLGPT